MRVEDTPGVDLVACEVMYGVRGAVCDGTDGESVVEIRVGDIELAFRWNAVWR